jgi:hypothetical protein
MKLISLKKSPRDEKKYVAVFDLGNGRTKTTHLGATGFSDFRSHRSEERKDSYIARHSARENFNDPTTAGALSRWLLWNKPTLEASLRDFKARFNL